MLNCLPEYITSMCMCEGRLFFSRILNFLKTMENKSKSCDPQFLHKTSTDELVLCTITTENPSFPMKFGYTQILSSAQMPACWEAEPGTGVYFIHMQKTSGSIDQLELYTILFTCKACRKLTMGKNILINCDNVTSVCVLGTGA